MATTLCALRPALAFVLRALAGTAFLALAAFLVCIA
jgi:hypothetical protein